MRRQLFIRLGQKSSGLDEMPPALGTTTGGDLYNENQTRVSWLRVEKPGQLSPVSHGSLTEAAVAASGCQIIVLVPGAEVLLTHVAVPSQNRQRIARAIPFALEERLGSEVEQLHFAIGARRADDQINTAVVDRERLDAWLVSLRAAGLQPDLIVPETQVLPARAGSWFVLNETCDATVSTGNQSGFAVDTDNLDMLLALAIGEAGAARPERIHVIDCLPAVASLPETVLAYPDMDLSREDFEQDVLTFLVQGFDEKNVINLLQGDYSRREQFSKLWRPWRAAAGLLLAWLLLQGGMAVAEVNRLNRQSAALQPQIEQVYRKAFPETRKIVNPRVQMERSLEALRNSQGQDGDGFLNLLENSGAALKATPDLQVRTISFKEGELNLEIEIGDLQSLDQLKQRLAGTSDLTIEIQSATSRDGRVQSRMQIRPQILPGEAAL